MSSQTEITCHEMVTNYMRVPAVGGLYLLRRDLPKLIAQFANGTKTLDYGCNSGRSTRFLKMLGLDVEGMDICDYMLALAKAQDPTVKYRQMENSWSVPANNGTYDFIYAGYVMSYNKSKHDMTLMLTELARVLKPGAICMFTVPDEDTYKYNWLVEKTNFDMNKNPVSGCRVNVEYKNYEFISKHYYWTRLDYREVICNSGLHLVCTHIPFGKDTDGFEWIDEKKRAVIMIYVVKKCL